jgi:hypothetical protein
MSDSPLNPYAFDEHKLEHESKQKAIDRVLEYLADTRHRVDTLVKAIFVLSGGALTISISLFLKTGAPHLAIGLTSALRWSWWLLFYSLATSASLLFLMICQGYWQAWQWQKVLAGDDNVPSTRLLKFVQVVNWILGATGFVSFVLGLGLLAYVSGSAVGEPVPVAALTLGTHPSAAAAAAATAATPGVIQ